MNMITFVLAATIASALRPLPLDDDTPGLQFIEIDRFGDDEDAPIGHITEVVQDDSGHYYMADAGFATIHVFSAEGEYLRQFGEAGQGPGELMMPFILGMTPNEQLTLAGSGGRVAIWDRQGNHLREFRRLHPASFARSIDVADDGSIVLAVFDPFAQTVIDIYGPDTEHVISIQSSRELSLDADPDVLEFFGGGSIDLEPEGTILYTQQNPYLVQRFDMQGRELTRTTAGGEAWLPAPPSPESWKKTFTVTMPGSSMDIRRIGVHILNNAVRNHDDAPSETLFRGFRISCGHQRPLGYRSSPPRWK